MGGGSRTHYWRPGITARHAVAERLPDGAELVAYCGEQITVDVSELRLAATDLSGL